jgi:hypothetical protein
MASLEITQSRACGQTPGRFGSGSFSPFNSKNPITTKATKDHEGFQFQCLPRGPSWLSGLRIEPLPQIFKVKKLKLMIAERHTLIRS